MVSPTRPPGRGLSTRLGCGTLQTRLGFAFPRTVEVRACRPVWRDAERAPSGHDKRTPPKDIPEGCACQVRFFGGICLSGPPFNIGSSIARSPGTTSVPLRTISWRDLLVRSVHCRLMIHSSSSGTTSVPLRTISSEGPACQVRRLTLDHPLRRHRARQACPSEKIPQVPPG